MIPAAASRCCDFCLHGWQSPTLNTGVFNDFLWPLPPSTPNPSDVLGLGSSSPQLQLAAGPSALQGAGRRLDTALCPPAALILHKISSRKRRRLRLPPHFKGWCLQLPLQTTLEEEGGFTWHSFSRKKHKSYKKPWAGCHNYLLLTHTTPLLQHYPPQHTHPIPKEPVKHSTPSEERRGETRQEGQGEKHLQFRRLFDFKIKI